MEIKQIKEQLSIVTVLNEYGITINKNKHCKCPFHKDDKPSLRIYLETNTYTCFGCGATGDVIQFIQDFEKCTKHQALKKAKELIGTAEIKPIKIITEVQEVINYSELFPKFKQSLHRSKKAISYLEERGIYDVKLEQGYNNGTKWNQLKNCIIYPLKNEQNEIVSLYGRNIAKTGTHYYTANRKGLYPNYPTAETKTLILTESVIDSATLQKYTDYQTLALYGTNGLTNEHLEAIKGIEKLEEIILFMDGDQAGNEAIEKHSNLLNELLPNITISKISTPENEDINSLVQSHEPEILNHLIENRSAIFSSIEKKTESKINTENPEYIIYESGSLQICVLGGINLFSLDKLKVTLRITRTDKQSPIYNIRQSNLDLYNDDATEKFIRKVAERLELGTREIQISIAELINGLEEYRLAQVEAQKPNKPQQREISEKRKAQVIEFLQSKDLLRRTNDLIGKTGMVGEENNRLLMFLVFTSRLREQPLHIISLGASGTGKTYLQEKISELIPEEHKLEITALSENALYYFERTELKNKLVLIEDLDGAQDDKILYAIRELMSKKRISKTIPIKDSKGNLKTVTLQVEGPICLAGTTTKERIYEDNANRSLLIYLDNSKAHKNQIMEYQQNLSAGTINKAKEGDIKRFLQDVQLMLEKVKVRNPYATKLNIPDTVFKPLRTNTHYLSFIETVTFYHQWQRPHRINKETGEKYIETTLEDIEEANKLLKDVLLAKSDELTKACRDFLELLKNYVAKNNKQSFYSKEIREAYRFAPTTLNRHLLELSRYGYLKIIGGNRARGYEYELLNSEEYQALKDNIQTALDEALENIKKEISKPVNQSSPVALVGK